MRITRGDRLLLYTDGIVETPNRQGKMYGEERVESTLRDGRGLAAEQAAEAIVQDVFRWRGKLQETSLDDDLTLMIVDLTGRGAKRI